MELENAVLFPDSLTWRKWLSENHDKTEEIWLIHYKKRSGMKSVSLADAVREAICFGWIDGKLRSIDEDKYILRYSPRRPGSVWSKINKDRAEAMIKSGKMTPVGLQKIEEARQNGMWDAAYTNLRRDKIPSDLKEALENDKEARKNFQAFANSYRNMYIGWIEGAKSENTRRNRIDEVVRRSSLNIKPV
jgi:uncharacterized protein YdeI (YjbR/CyaY-like superfamily)